MNGNALYNDLIAYQGSAAENHSFKWFLAICHIIWHLYKFLIVYISHYPYNFKYICRHFLVELILFYPKHLFQTVYGWGSQYIDNHHFTTT